MFSDCCCGIIRNQIFRDCPVILQCVNRTGDEVGDLLVFKYLGIEVITDTDCCNKGVDLFYLTRFRIEKQFRLIPNPIL